MEQREAKKGKYLRPIERTIKFIEDTKKAKEEDKTFRDKFRKEIEDPAASKEKNDATVFKFMNDRKRLDTYLERVIIVLHTLEY